jgi:hypothetical protein
MMGVNLAEAVAVFINYFWQSLAPAGSRSGLPMGDSATLSGLNSYSIRLTPGTQLRGEPEANGCNAFDVIIFDAADANSRRARRSNGLTLLDESGRQRAATLEVRWRH